MKKKNKKINLFKKIFFTLLFGICSVVLLGSWTYNPQTDTITSDNLLNIPNQDTTTLQGITYSITNNTISINGTATDYPRIVDRFVIYLEFGTYTLSKQNNVPDLFIWVGDNYYEANTIVNTDNQSATFTINNVGTYYISVVCVLGVSYNTSTSIMLNSGSSILPFEPYGNYVNQTLYDNLQIDYEQLYDDYQNLNDSYTSLQNSYNLLEANYDNLELQYNTLQQNYNILQTDYNTLESSYNDLSSRFSTLTDEYDTLLEEYQDLQQEYNDLQAQYNLIFDNYNQSNIYKYFSGCNVYCFDNNTQSLDYYINNTNTAVASGNFATISTESSFASYSDLPSSIRTYISNIQPNVTINGYIMFKLNVPNSLGANIEYNYYGNGLKTALYNSITGDYLINELSEVGNISSLLTDTLHSYDYLFIQFVSGDINYSRIYADENLQSYSNGYNTAMSNLNDYVQNYKNQIADLNIIIKNKQVQIDDLNNQLSNTLGWRPLFFAMADTPIKVVANVLGFELFGINLFQAFIGIITALAVIWLIRKIWK